MRNYLYTYVDYHSISSGLCCFRVGSLGSVGLSFKGSKIVDIGSYPYFNEKPGTILVLRSVNNEVIKECEKEVNSLIKKISKK